MPPKSSRAKATAKTKRKTQTSSKDETLCLVCGCNIVELSSSERIAHVNECLDKKESEESTANAVKCDDGANDVLIAEILAKDDDDANYSCGVCGKNLSRQSLARRQIHVEKCCIRQEEEREVAQEIAFVRQMKEDQQNSEAFSSMSEPHIRAKKTAATTALTTTVSSSSTTSTASSKLKLKKKSTNVSHIVEDPEYSCKVCTKNLGELPFNSRVKHLRDCARKHGVSLSSFKFSESGSVHVPVSSDTDAVQLPLSVHDGEDEDIAPETQVLPSTSRTTRARIGQGISRATSSLGMGIGIGPSSSSSLSTMEPTSTTATAAAGGATATANRNNLNNGRASSRGGGDSGMLEVEISSLFSTSVSLLRAAYQTKLAQIESMFEAQKRILTESRDAVLSVVRHGSGSSSAVGVGVGVELDWGKWGVDRVDSVDADAAASAGVSLREDLSVLDSTSLNDYINKLKRVVNKVYGTDGGGGGSGDPLEENENEAGGGDGVSEMDVDEEVLSDNDDDDNDDDELSMSIRPLFERLGAVTSTATTTAAVQSRNPVQIPRYPSRGQQAINASTTTTMRSTRSARSTRSVQQRITDSLQFPNHDLSDTDLAKTKNFIKRGLRKELHAVIKANTQMYQRMLTYDVIDLDEIVSAIRSGGLQCPKKAIQLFLDEQGISYRNTS